MNLNDKLCHKILCELELKRQVQVHGVPKTFLLTLNNYQCYESNLSTLNRSSGAPPSELSTNS